MSRVWPGDVSTTTDLTWLIAREGRVYVPDDFPVTDAIVADYGGDPHRVILDGGSCVAGPDGQRVIPPVQGEQRLGRVPWIL